MRARHRACKLKLREPHDPVAPLVSRLGAISVYAVKGDWQLTNTIQSKILAMAFSMAAEIERDLISKRTREALIAKKEQGLPLGRPRGIGKSKLDAHRVEIEALLNNGATQKFILNPAVG